MFYPGGGVSGKRAFAGGRRAAARARSPPISRAPARDSGGPGHYLLGKNLYHIDFASFFEDLWRFRPTRSPVLLPRNGQRGGGEGFGLEVGSYEVAYHADRSCGRFPS